VTALLCLIAAVVLAWASTLIVKAVRAGDEDTERALRIQREYAVPECAVEEPRGRRAHVKQKPEITSNYRTEPSR
jgi:hypothetical protein